MRMGGAGAAPARVLGAAPAGVAPSRAPDTTVVAPGRRAPVARASSTTRPRPTTRRAATRWPSRASRTTSSTYPNTDLTDNAQYWIGECHYAQKKLPGGGRGLRQAPEAVAQERQGRRGAAQEGLRPARARPEGRGRRPAPVRRPRVSDLRGGPARPRPPEDARGRRPLTGLRTRRSGCDRLPRRRGCRGATSKTERRSLDGKHQVGGEADRPDEPAPASATRACVRACAAP